LNVNEARENILRRLRENTPAVAPQGHITQSVPARDSEQRIACFSERQRAVHGEVHRMDKSQWLNWLALELPRRGLQRVLVGTGEIGRQLTRMAARGIRIEQYEQPVEQWKATLFADVDVAITGTRCAIAETGSLVLWPDADEPRLMSLVPPVHIALLDAGTIHDTFAETIEKEAWAAGMPTNALLISGPSKTADIEQTLAYGIHGPKQLITLILE
jgi:L-lactate dehydrogenase complex protein LldG